MIRPMCWRFPRAHTGVNAQIRASDAPCFALWGLRSRGPRICLGFSLRQRIAEAAYSFLRSRIAPGTLVNADESPNWNELHARFEMKRIIHEEAYSQDCACTNWAEEFFSRMRRAEIGHHTTTSPASTSSTTRRKPRGAKITAGRAMVRRLTVSPGWR